jgi:L-asparaginase II/predicted PurR-regulated permease PerM
MDLPDRCVVGEPSWAGGVEQLDGAGGAVVADDAFADASGQPVTNGVRDHRRLRSNGHASIVTRRLTTLRPVAEDSPSGPPPVSNGSGSLPGWVIPATIIFWIGFLGTLLVRHLWDRLDSLALLLVISLFLALAIEPGVNRLHFRGWRRGRATATILFGVFAAFLVFVAAIGTLVGTQIAELLQNSETYITDTVDFINDNFNAGLDPEEVIAQFNDPDGAVQRFIKSQQDEALRLSARVLGALLQGFSVLLFTYYLVADGPRLRRAICSRLRPERQLQVLSAWELAITKTGGYLYSRALLALLSAFFHWIVFQAVGVPAPIPLALWVGFVSQFLPVVGTYLAGILPILITFIDSQVLGADRARLHRRLSADRELLLLAPHHGTHHGAPSSRGVRCGPRRRARARCDRSRARVTRGGDGAGHRERLGAPTRRGGEPAHRGSRDPHRQTQTAGAVTVVTSTDSPYVPVAATRRSGFDESVHFGAAVAVDAGGEVIWSVGDPIVQIYPRSSLKPLQARAMVDLGLRLPPELLALVCASHDGTPAHLDGVRRILTAAGLDETSLGNTAALPLDPDSAEAVLRGGGGRTALHMNCSGKHAGMLATCVLNGWDVETYLHPDHPLQQRIVEDVARLADGVVHVGVDGCGAPTFVTSLVGLARAFGSIAAEHGPVHEAMTRHPEMVGGDARAVTIMMRSFLGLMAKDGAEGVLAAGLPDGSAMALKIADGAKRAVPAVALAALGALGLDIATVADRLDQPILGHGRRVGEVRSLVGTGST